MTERSDEVTSRLAGVRERIARACDDAGRDPADVTLGFGLRSSRQPHDRLGDNLLGQLVNAQPALAQGAQAVVADLVVDLDCGSFPPIATSTTR